MENNKKLDMEKTIVYGRAGTGMSCAMLKILQKYHDKGYKTIEIADSKEDVKEI